jgi:hypothetical protein
MSKIEHAAADEAERVVKAWAQKPMHWGSKYFIPALSCSVLLIQYESSQSNQQRPRRMEDL